MSASMPASASAMLVPRWARISFKGPKPPQTEGAEPSRAFVCRHARHRTQVAEHGRPSYGGGRHLGGPGHGLHHYASRGTLAELAEEQHPEEPLLCSGGQGEQFHKESLLFVQIELLSGYLSGLDPANVVLANPFLT